MTEKIKFNVKETVSKEISETKIKLVENKVVDGQVVNEELPELTVMGKMNNAQAMRFVKKEFKGRSLLVLSVITESKNYEMPLETFLANASIKEEVKEV